MFVDIPEVEAKKIQHSINTNGKVITLNLEFFDPSDCNEVVRFLTEVIDEMTAEGE